MGKIKKTGEKKPNESQQGNKYDKVLKEHLEITLPTVIKDILGLNLSVSEEIPDDIQHTKERKPDALKKVTDTDGNKYVLHVEFQVPNEKEMVYRMAEYNIMLMRKYEIPIKQYVIFLKKNKPTMATSIDAENLKYNYNLIRISEIDYKLFLRSENPEIKMLGILGDFGQDDKDKAIQAIIDQVQEKSKSDFAKKRYFQQLRIFVQLRTSIEQQFEQAMQSVSTFFKEEKDFLYKKGEQKAQAKALEEKKEIARELKNKGLAIDFISKTVKLTIKEIEAL